MNYNPTPKESFLSDPDAAKSHHQLVESDALRQSLAAALAQYTRRQSILTPTDLGSAAMIFMRIQGAQEFVETFLNLAETVNPPITLDAANLSTNVRVKKN